MSEIDTYLSRHFMNVEQMAAASQLSVDQLHELVREQLVPAPSYVVTASSTIRSWVFGEMQAGAATDGEYFHPASVAWAEKARQIIAEVGRERAPEVLKIRFAENLQVALANLDATTWRLTDSFADDGSVIPEGLRKRVQTIWTHFLHGTCGLCVANPVSEAEIARKEVLQEKLTALSDNGAKSDFSAAQTRVILALIAAYAASAMPFSPVEYPISSRKRLVEDLAGRLDAGTTEHAAQRQSKTG